jgi:predicted nucleic acid-binding protein
MSDAETEVSLCDAADQQLLGTLGLSRANYLITGDNDLLVVAEKYPIVTPALFWARHC